MAIETSTPERRRVIALSNLSRLQVRFVINQTSNLQDVVAFLRILAWDTLISQEERATWSEMREEARTSLVEAFRAGDGTAFAYYLCFLSVVNARSAEDRAFMDSISDY